MNKHYSLKNILQQDAIYNVIFVERSYGKTNEQKRRNCKRKAERKKNSTMNISKS